ncbi:PepSY domain-containing protein [Psychrobacillus sp. BL-248-WT-3]|uniref:PepSY domain-containing protein n=1 Tax=Psychrobacillus sp. BL-248-WT-3 TaxID=2725306 RepID=UPI00146BF50F|nr:PepSY domain-containing protein [Psychrobacillus sp. BL-248-WT-3]NME05008.1 PepSY domain-containing protein [Psychrobacillus sp. BL-248-WT-3]
MKFTKIKKYTLIFVSVIVIVGTGFLFNVTQTNRQFMSENDVRSQLEQLYDAEVTDITLKENVYKAVITKGGSVYLVEVNSTNGDIYTMEQTNEYMLTGISQPVEQSEFATYSDTFEVREYPLTSNIRKKETNNNIVVEMSPITQIQVKEDSMSMVNKVETAQATEMKLIKSSISATSSIQEKLSDSKVDKPITEVIKNAIKDVLKTEPVKTEEVKKEPVKVEVAKSDEGKADAKAEAAADSIEGIKTDSSKTEPTKTDISKTETKNETSKVEPVKVESTKTETSKTEEPKKEEAKKEEPDASSTSNNKTQTETKKPDEAKQESTATVLITPEQATKIAQQQYKGTVDSNSFIKTNEGGYYLIVMQTADGNSKDSKDKKTKATIQVHAISGKILSVTWE